MNYLDLWEIILTDLEGKRFEALYAGPLNGPFALEFRMRSNSLSMSPICLYDISCKQMSEAECCFQNESDTTQTRVYRVLPKKIFF